MIEFEGVSKRYPSGDLAVADLTLKVPRGKTMALVGSSGSGKSTLLRMVNRMVAPTGGRVRISGQDVAHKDPVQLRRSIGYVMQSGGLLPHRTIVDNVATVPLLNGVSRTVARRDAYDLLERVGLNARLGPRYPEQLSGGQQQRVGVARALAADPDILLMDEPFGAVDPIVRAELQQDLRSLQADLGKTVLFVTHDIDEAFTVADQIAILGTGGTLAQVDTPERLISGPANGFVAAFLGITDGRRDLHVIEAEGRSVVTDGSGRPLGVLAP